MLLDWTWTSAFLAARAAGKSVEYAEIDAVIRMGCRAKRTAGWVRGPRLVQP